MSLLKYLKTKLKSLSSSLKGVFGNIKNRFKNQKDDNPIARTSNRTEPTYDSTELGKKNSDTPTVGKPLKGNEYNKSFSSFSDQYSLSACNGDGGYISDDGSLYINENSSENSDFSSEEFQEIKKQKTVKPEKKQEKIKPSKKKDDNKSKEILPMDYNIVGSEIIKQSPEHRLISEERKVRKKKVISKELPAKKSRKYKKNKYNKERKDTNSVCTNLSFKTTDAHIKLINRKRRDDSSIPKIIQLEIPIDSNDNILFGVDTTNCVKNMKNTHLPKKFSKRQVPSEIFIEINGENSFDDKSVTKEIKQDFHDKLINEDPTNCIKNKPNRHLPKNYSNNPIPKEVFINICDENLTNRIENKIVEILPQKENNDNILVKDTSKNSLNNQSATETTDSSSISTDKEIVNAYINNNTTSLSNAANNLPEVEPIKSKASNEKLEPEGSTIFVTSYYKKQLPQEYCKAA